MAKDGGGHDHFGVVAALEDLQVGAAGERGFDADADFARFEGGRRDVFDLDFFPTVQDGGFHPGSLEAPTGQRKKVLCVEAQAHTRRPLTCANALRNVAARPDI